MHVHVHIHACSCSCVHVHEHVCTCTLYIVHVHCTCSQWTHFFSFYESISYSSDWWTLRLKINGKQYLSFPLTCAHVNVNVRTVQSVTVLPSFLLSFLLSSSLSFPIKLWDTHVHVHCNKEHTIIYTRWFMHVHVHVHRICTFVLHTCTCTCMYSWNTLHVDVTYFLCLDVIIRTQFELLQDKIIINTP